MDDSTRVALPDRAALYYPRIHFRDLEWLKGTLLAFGRVHRIVPDDHPLDRDDEAVVFLSRRHGAADPLIIEESPDAMFIEDAQRRLWDLLQETDPAVLQARFGAQAASVRELETGPYDLAQSKIHYGMLEELERHRLVWAPTDGTRGSWLRIHPDLGEAIMGVSAIAAARARGCDVVTDSSDLHASLAALDEASLLGGIVRPHAAIAPDLDAAHATDLLVHAVLTTHFDLRQLSMDRIRAMVRDGADLRAFRSHLHTYASRLPETLDPAERTRRLEELATQMVADWNELERRLTPQMKSALRSAASEATESMVSDAAKTLASAAVMGTAMATVTGLTLPGIGAALLAGLGVPIGLALLKTARRSRRAPSDGPTRYLTRIASQGGVLLTVPRPYARLPD